MIIKEGDSGSYVLLLQQALNARGAGLVEDSQFGPATLAAVQAFQAHNGLVPDGEAGPLTQAALQGAVAVPPPSNNPPPVSTGGPLLGLDVYHLDDIQSWSKMINGGYYYVFIKASDGLSTDPKGQEYFNAAKAAGLIVGLYHFYEPSIDISSQAAHFQSVINNIGLAKTDLPPVFDFERADGNFSSTDAANCFLFLRDIQQSSGRLPLLYCSDSTPAAINNPSWLSQYPLWVARYGAAPRNQYVFWQKSESATIPGLGNQGDENIFNGSLADLQKWISTT